MHKGRTGDRDFSKPHKFHAKAVPRIGDLGIVAGIAVALVPIFLQLGRPALDLGLILLACTLPLLAAGILHDMSDRLSPRHRLLATAVSTALPFQFFGAAILRTDILGLDWLASLWLGSVLPAMLLVFIVSYALLYRRIVKFRSLLWWRAATKSSVAASGRHQPR